MTTQQADDPIERIPTPKGLTLQVDFAWSKFRNTISSKSPSGTLTPLYIQHFRPTKPQLRFELADTHQQFATGLLKSVSITSEITLHGRAITLTPLSNWKSKYNYLSSTLSRDPDTPEPVTWLTNSSMKLWNFVCLDKNQLPIAKFSANIWALKEVGNFHFTESGEELGREARDEVVVVGLTLFYVICHRMNNPLNILGSMFGKAGPVRGTENGGSETRSGSGNGQAVEMDSRKAK